MPDNATRVNAAAGVLLALSLRVSRLRRVAQTLVLWTLAIFGTLTCGAAIAPHGCSKGKAYVTAMKSDLRNLVSAQESFMEEHHRYGNNAELASSLGFRSSTGVTVVIESADSQRWQARATHSQLKGSCTILVGSATAGANGVEGEPICNADLPRPRVTPEEFLFNISVDCWLFAFSVARRRRRLEEEALMDSAAIDSEWNELCALEGHTNDRSNPWQTRRTWARRCKVPASA